MSELELDLELEIEIANQRIATRIKERRKPRPTWREVKEKYLLETGEIF